jgi:P2-related tail formation protein
VNYLERQLENPVRLARIKRWFYFGLATMALAEIVLPLMCYLLKLVCEASNLPALAELLHVDPPDFWFERIPAWGSLYGLASCVAIIVVSKFLGKVWLMRREDYYDS